MLSWPINTFDAVIYFFLFVAVVMGFMTGMLRSLATIFGYLAAMGIVVTFAPQLAPVLKRDSSSRRRRYGLRAFLQGSQWRPVLSEAGRQGLNALPPEVEEY